METMVKGILVDPFGQTVTESELPRGRGLLAAVYAAIGSDCVTVVRAGDFFGGAGDAFLYVDDNGLLRREQAFTQVGHKPIAGKFIVLRDVGNLDDDEEGGGGDSWLASVDFTAGDVRSRIRFVSPRFAAASIDLGTQRAAAAFVSRDMHVEHCGMGTLVITPKES